MISLIDDILRTKPVSDGIYASTVQAMYEPYLMPQDYGLRTDVRWLQTDHGQRHRPSIQDERMVQLQHLSVQHRQSDESDVYLPIAEAERHDPESRLCHYRGRLYGPRCIRCLQGDAAGISENHQHKTYDEIKILYRTGKIMKNKNYFILLVLFLSALQIKSAVFIRQRALWCSLLS